DGGYQNNFPCAQIRVLRVLAKQLDKRLMRYILLVFSFCAVCFTPAVAMAADDAENGYIYRTLNRPVPGGVAVVPLGQSDTAPVVDYNSHRAIVVRDTDNQWVAIVG